MFGYMGDRISEAIKNIKGMGKITEDNISSALSSTVLTSISCTAVSSSANEIQGKEKEITIANNTAKIFL